MWAWCPFWVGVLMALYRLFSFSVIIAIFRFLFLLLSVLIIYVFLCINSAPLCPSWSSHRNYPKRLHLLVFLPELENPKLFPVAFKWRLSGTLQMCLHG